jgi:hypothetical protein
MICAYGWARILFTVGPLTGFSVCQAADTRSPPMSLLGPPWLAHPGQRQQSQPHRAKTLGRRAMDAQKEAAILADLLASKAGIIKLAAAHGVGVGTVQRIKAALTA